MRQDAYERSKSGWARESKNRNIFRIHGSRSSFIEGWAAPDTPTKVSGGFFSFSLFFLVFLVFLVFHLDPSPYPDPYPDPD